MPPPYTNQPKRCGDCRMPLALPRHTRTQRCPKCQRGFARSRNITHGALRYVKLKAEGRWPMCSVEGCDREAKNGARDALRGPRRALGARART